MEFVLGIIGYALFFAISIMIRKIEKLKEELEYTKTELKKEREFVVFLNETFLMEENDEIYAKSDNITMCNLVARLTHGECGIILIQKERNLRIIILSR